MLPPNSEEHKRIFPAIKPDGSWVRLANGDKWSFGSLPLSPKRAKWFIDKLQEIQKFKPQNDAEIYFQIGHDIVLAALRLNYNVTDEEAEGLFRLAHLVEIINALNGEHQVAQLMNQGNEEITDIEKNC